MSTDVAVADATTLARFQSSLESEQAAERDLLVSLVKSVLVALPISIVIFLFMMAIAISDKVEWFVWISIGVGLGVIGACLLGALAGATLNAHKLDEVDRHTYGA